jgi:hypothetical protein
MWCFGVLAEVSIAADALRVSSASNGLYNNYSGSAVAMWQGCWTHYSSRVMANIGRGILDTFVVSMRAEI